MTARGWRRVVSTDLCLWTVSIALAGAGIAVAATSAAPAIAGGFVAVAQAPAAARPGAKVRTSGRIDVLVAEALAGGPEAQILSATDPAQVLRERDGAGIWLGAWSGQTPVPTGLVRHSLAYPVGPMAILRSDTTIHDWKALASRTVCVVEGEPYVGEIAERFAAVEQRYPSAADALLAVRAGQCDAGVLGDQLLDALQKFPEWKKFSARLPAYRRADMVWVSTQAGADAGWSARTRAFTPARLAAMTAQQARDIAFEVYLDQVIPDCH